MLIGLMITALAAAPAVAQDTVLGVERGDRLSVENHRGEVVIDTWDRNAVRVTGDLDDGRVESARAGSQLRVRTRGARGGPIDADLRITVPRWMSVRVSGNQLDVTVRGTAGEVAVETVGGDIDVAGGAGIISLRTIQGEISVRDSRARVEAVSVNDDVLLQDISGDIDVETTNGDITLRGVRAAAVRATTVNGDVVYNGTIQDDGRYGFSTHNGSIALTVPSDANATVSVSTYHGDFESDFPVRLTGTTRDRQFNFTLGSGSGRVELESFNGSIRLRRP